MTDRFEQVRALFENARRLHGDQRDDYITESCKGDHDLERELRSLLENLDQENYLSTGGPPQTIPGQMGGAYEPGDTIGRYRVESIIGEGGFGVVYRAHQTDPVDRDVALKVLKPGMDSAAILSRFAAERQTLAVMDHPFVAKLFDGGITSSGHPFFVMEYVAGLPITTYCDENRLSVVQRLEVVTDVCKAVQHAHTKGVLHRDLKPSNILVRSVEGKPRPVVIDFGIAKAVDPDHASHSVITEAGQLLGTPEYMSPEQAAGQSKDIDTRTDVYAIGVILYELLVGARPFDRDTLQQAGMLGIQRVICEQTPPKPSTRLSSLNAEVGTGQADDKHGATAARVARDRSTDARGLASLLRKDLDWVVMRCLEKDRDRRYNTVSEIAADIGRFLRHEPVEAQAPTTTYRLAKFVRRNRLPVAAAAVAGIALVAGTAASITFAVSADRSRAAEAQQRIVAERSEERVSLVNRFLLDDLFYATNTQTLGRNATLDQLVDRAEGRIDERFGDDPSLEARVHGLIAQMRRNMEQMPLAIESYSKAIDLHERAVDLTPKRRATHYFGRAQAYQFTGQLDNAEADIFKAISVVDPDGTKDWTSYVDLWATLGILRGAQERYEEAEAIYDQVISYWIESNTEDKARVLSTMSQRLAMLMRQRRYDEVVEAAEQMRQYSQDVPGRSALSARNIAAFYQVQIMRGQGRGAEAAPVSAELIKSMRELEGENSWGYATAVMSHAGNVGDTGDITRAMVFVEEATERVAAIFGPHHYEMERWANQVAAYATAWGDDAIYEDWRTAGLLLRLYVAGPGEIESVEGILAEGAALLGSAEIWLETTLAEEAKLPEGHNKRARYLAHAAHLLAIAEPGPETHAKIVRLHEAAARAVSDAERPEEVAAVIRNVVTRYADQRGDE